jgi:tetratricopeptide (TPR) repeat protein
MGCLFRFRCDHKNSCYKLDKLAFEKYLKIYYQAEALVKTGDLVHAESIAKTALSSADKIFLQHDIRIASPLILLGQIHQASSDVAAAIVCFERAYIVYSNEYGSVHLHVQEITFLLINALLIISDWEKAFTYAEMNYQILIDFEGECTCYLIAETARQLGSIYKHFSMYEKEEVMYQKSIEHYDVCPDLETRARVDKNYESYGGYLGMMRKQYADLKVRMEAAAVAPIPKFIEQVSCCTDSS